jgi:hypothetical protein
MTSRRGDEETLPTSDLIAGLKKHAKRYGADGIMETAADFFHDGRMTFNDVIEMQEHLDALEREALKKWAPNRRLTVEERVNRVLGIEPEEDA